MKEIWKDIPGYEGKYQVSNFGNVKTFHYLGMPGVEALLKQAPSSAKAKPYLKVCLCKDGKTKRFYVHRLVAMTFLANPDNLPEVNHLDENPTNNRLDNLVWSTSAENSNWGTRNERMGKANINNPNFSKPIICVETGIEYPSAREATRQLGISFTMICRCCKQQTSHYTAGGYHWKYK